MPTVRWLRGRLEPLESSRNVYWSRIAMNQYLGMPASDRSAMIEEDRSYPVSYQPGRGREYRAIGRWTRRPRVSGPPATTISERPNSIRSMVLWGSAPLHTRIREPRYVPTVPRLRAAHRRELPERRAAESVRRACGRDGAEYPTRWPRFTTVSRSHPPYDGSRSQSIIAQEIDRIKRRMSSR